MFGKKFMFIYKLRGTVTEVNYSAYEDGTDFYRSDHKYRPPKSMVL